VHQCKHCLTVYDAKEGDKENNIAPGTSFESLPEDYTCSLCEGSKTDFVKKEKGELGIKV
jgi:rubredoxin